MNCLGESLRVESVMLGVLAGDSSPGQVICSAGWGSSDTISLWVKASGMK